MSKKNQKDPSEGQIAAALGRTGPFGAVSRWLYRNRRVLQALHELGRKCRELETMDQAVLSETITNFQKALHHQAPYLFELFSRVMQAMQDNSVLSWVIKAFAELATSGLKVYQPHDTLAEMLAETDMTVLAEDIQLPFAAVVMTVPEQLRATAPIAVSEVRKTVFDAMPDTTRTKHNFPSWNQLQDLHADYVVLHETPPTVLEPRSITVGLLPAKFFDTDFAIDRSIIAEVMPGGGTETGRMNISNTDRGLIYSPCPAIGMHYPLLSGITMEECFEQSCGVGDFKGAHRLNELEEDGLHTLFRMGLNAMMALSFADHDVAVPELPKVVRRASYDTTREVERSVAATIRLDQTMLLGPVAAPASPTDPTDTTHAEAVARREMKPHWRRGHWRRFAVGEGRKDRVWKWVPAIFVNQARLIEAGFEMADTMVEIKRRRG